MNRNSVKALLDINIIDLSCSNFMKTVHARVDNIGGLILLLMDGVVHARYWLPS